MFIRLRANSKYSNSQDDEISGYTQGIGKLGLSIEQVFMYYGDEEFEIHIEVLDEELEQARKRSLC